MSLDPEEEYFLQDIPAMYQTSTPRNEVIGRFLSPVIDDDALPLSDVLTASVVAPSLQVFWMGMVHAPSPTWLPNTMWLERGALVFPTLLHGSGLACCWIAGALAAKAYTKEAIDPTVEGYPTVIWTILKAGAFATGILIFATQLDLLAEFGRYVQPGESEATDLRLLSAVVEILNDVVFEASTITAFRLLLAVSTERNTPSLF
eukprot:CAMPEP_0116860268 /NCGR_PEP_ID=MMETSP0418-20121206/22307_1 /TAXON_ID=1158023 /ORGANISM="Astrosyne radiata, Strain 13vi08-1A" /LENGTH=203 /DNA_ID=CAMNT_0004494629 /DNA_START=111 /DNA_END=722 /DNA_ORIENTATION=+